ncbi:MAG: hypothetical protein R2830_25980 [Saprospiraceae bacterium]
MKFKILLPLMVLTVLFAACGKDTTVPAANVDCTAVTYSGTINPLILQSCGGSNCHGQNGRQGDLTTYAKLSAYVNNGRFKREVLDNQTMPQGSSLSSEQLGQIKCWLGAGAPQN